MTTNLAECINSVLRGAQSLPISALVTTTFETIKDWFVQQDTRADCMLRVGHVYLGDIAAILRKNEQQYIMCHVERLGKYLVEE